MSVTREHLDVWVREGILRVGSRAFPLDTITRATTAELAPNRGATVARYAVTVALGIVPAAVVSALAPDLLSVLVTVTALTWFTTRTVHLARAMKQTWYALTIETADGVHDVLTSADPHAVAAVAFRVRDAVNHRATRHDDPPNRINQA